MKPLGGEKIFIATSSFSAVDKSPLDCLRRTGCEITRNPFNRRLTKPELLKQLASRVTGIIAGLEVLDREVLEKSDLKVISRCGSGLSNVDLITAKELGITVCSTPDAPTEAVAELTLAAMLSLVRNVPEMDGELHAGRWTKRIGFELAGKTVAIIGFGRIGRRVASLLRPFSVRIIAVETDACRKPKGIRFTALGKALRLADIITIHASGEKQIIGKKEFGSIKRGAFLLNAARGGLIDEKSLKKALDDGIIKGAWLDVFENEPYQGELKRYPQVIMTPHTGSYTVECRKAMEMEAVNNLIGAFRKIKGKDKI